MDSNSIGLNQREKLKEAGILILSFLLVGWGLNVGLWPYDEGVIHVGAARLALGELPWRDFWTLYPPGTMSLLLSVQNFFGDGVILSRWINWVVFSSILILFRSFLWREDKPIFLAYLFVVLYLSALAPIFVPVNLAVMLILFWFVLFNKWNSSGNTTWCVFMGLVLAMLLFVRHDFFLFLLFGHVVLWKNQMKLTYFLTYFFAFFLASSVLWLPYFDLVSLQEVLSTLFIYPILKFKASRGGGGSLQKGGFIYSLFVYGGIFIYGFTLYRVFREKDEKSLWFFEKRVLSFLILGLLFYFNGRPDLIHFFPAFLFLCLLLSWGSMVKRKSLSGVFGFFRRVEGWVLLFFLVLKVFYYHGEFQAIPLRSSSNVPKLKGVWMGDPSAYDDLYKFLIDKKEKQDGYMFLTSAPTNKLDTTEVLLYHLMPNKPVGYYHELHPGVADTSFAIQRIKDDLMNERSIDLVLEGNERDWNQEASSLDRWIIGHFTPIRRIGRFKIYKRKKEVDVD